MSVVPATITTTQVVVVVAETTPTLHRATQNRRQKSANAVEINARAVFNVAAGRATTPLASAGQKKKILLHESPSPSHSRRVVVAESSVAPVRIAAAKDAANEVVYVEELDPRVKIRANGTLVGMPTFCISASVCLLTLYICILSYT